MFEGQWGQDIISDNAGTNQIRLEGVSPSDVYLYRDNAQLMIKQLGSENSIQILYQFDDNINHNPISSILFADGQYGKAPSLSNLRSSEHNRMMYVTV
ncbi:hypothetical protein LP089_12720 (plasmid) [Moraxella bovis]|uniref:hypothetical protein n=1 Tax=Moraxella bovis TaxID=476 RepID=UPI002226374C|nr:hypothetical protein [Moraxella bovis]UYZ72092.1 hypothetical protein LP089_12720 [Moraxella bovis]